jgi:hypothetical protein
MADGLVAMGADFVLQSASAVGGSYSPVNDMNSYRKTNTRNNQTFAVFMKTVAYVIPGTRESTWTVSGFLSLGDTGQDTLRLAESTDATAAIKVLPDGSNGFEQEVNVGTTTHEATPEGLQGYSFDFSAAAAGVIIGSGPVL